MRILWITNTIFPAPSRALGLPEPFVGGWMYGLASQVAASPGICLAVATTHAGKDLKRYDIDGVRYYLLPARSIAAYQGTLEPLWLEVCKEFKPDIVHIHGTEFSHGLACMRSSPGLKYVVSIQGLVGVYSRYYYAGSTTWELLKSVTCRDIVRRDTVFHGKREFQHRGAFEREYLRRTRHVIGRTRWDYAHVRHFNPDASYHFCNESLRESFYSAAKWNTQSKTDHSIFLSQASYPIKGAHQVFKAAALLKEEFPEIQIRLAGASVIRNTTLSERLRLSGYGNYLLGLIRRNNLHSHVQFLGPLNEQKMIEEYRNAHVFICPSSIENSPNSLGEAQLLGTPSIAAFVGGIPDMVTHGKTGLLYRFEEIEMLAENIREVFTNDGLAQRLSSGGIETASKRHDSRANLEQMLHIYRSM